MSCLINIEVILKDKLSLFILMKAELQKAMSALNEDDADNFSAYLNKAQAYTSAIDEKEINCKHEIEKLKEEEKDNLNKIYSCFSSQASSVIFSQQGLSDEYKNIYNILNESNFVLRELVILNQSLQKKAADITAETKQKLKGIKNERKLSAYSKTL